MPDHCWIFLNVLKYAWKCLNKLFWLCQGSQYTLLSYTFEGVLYTWKGFEYALNMSYKDIIIIVTNAIVSEFLPVWFAH